MPGKQTASKIHRRLQNQNRQKDRSEQRNCSKRKETTNKNDRNGDYENHKFKYTYLQRTVNNTTRAREIVIDYVMKQRACELNQGC